jgi:D-alanine-D-alanine ligase
VSAFGAVRKKRIAVLYGGWSAERAISLKSGAAVLAALKRLGIPRVGVDVRRNAARRLGRLRADLAFLAMHGPFGEDGKLQALLDAAGMPYTGSGVLASAVAMHKPTSKSLFRAAGLPTPDWTVVERGAKASDVRLPLQWVVKPASQGSAIGISVVRTRGQFAAALRKALKLEREVLVERFVPGVEVTAAVLGGRCLPVIEIVPKHRFYDFYSKYAPGGSRHIVPARLPKKVLARVARVSTDAFKVLGCRHLARVDLMVPKSGRPTLLEVNTLPGLTGTSLFPDAARAAGMDFDALVLEIVRLALKSA